METKFSDLNTLVLQINPKLEGGNIEVNHIQASKIATYLYIPRNNSQNYIWCPLQYFQNSASLAEKWILDNGNKLSLDFTENLNKVIIAEIKNGGEYKINIPIDYSLRLFKYFKLDVCHNKSTFNGFDCYAFISFIADVEYFPENPQFNYIKKEPDMGDFIVLANSDLLPNSIKHWALCLGNNYYLSKFGKSGGNAENLLSVTNLDTMKELYDSCHVFVAVPVTNARKWKGYIVK